MVGSEETRAWTEPQVSKTTKNPLVSLVGPEDFFCNSDKETKRFIQQNESANCRDH
jgi:hypothetical protein